MEIKITMFKFVQGSGRGEHTLIWHIWVHSLCWDRIPSNYILWECMLKTYSFLGTEIQKRSSTGISVWQWSFCVPYNYFQLRSSYPLWAEMC